MFSFIKIIISIDEPEDKVRDRIKIQSDEGTTS
jgi:hypothetical protein